MPKPQDQDDAKLLDELMNGPDASNPGSESGFSAQWNQLFSSQTPQHPKSQDQGEEDEFSQFISSRSFQGDQSLLGADLKESQAKKQSESSSNFLPSKLFDLNQSLHQAGQTSWFLFLINLTLSSLLCFLMQVKRTCFETFRCQVQPSRLQFKRSWTRPKRTRKSRT